MGCCPRRNACCKTCLRERWDTEVRWINTLMEKHQPGNPETILFNLSPSFPHKASISLIIK